MTTSPMDIGPLTWREQQLVLDDRIRRARRRFELLRPMVKVASHEDGEILFEMIVEAKREEERLQRGKEILG